MLDQPDDEILDPTEFYENWGHPEIEFKLNWIGMLSGLLKHDRCWHEASGAEGEGAALSAYGNAMEGYCNVERFYKQELGLSFTWNMPPVIEDYLDAVHGVVSVLTASQEDKLTLSWRGRTAAAWASLNDAATEVRKLNPSDLQFVDVFE